MEIKGDPAGNGPETADRCERILQGNHGNARDFRKFPDAGENGEPSACDATQRCQGQHPSAEIHGNRSEQFAINPKPCYSAQGSCSGYSAAWLARLTGGQEVMGSNPVSPIFP